MAVDATQPEACRSRQAQKGPRRSASNWGALSSNDGQDLLDGVAPKKLERHAFQGRMLGRFHDVDARRASSAPGMLFVSVPTHTPTLRSIAPVRKYLARQENCGSISSSAKTV